ncbi:hypothetical protein C5S53_06440 [Methanophagales archaeon]|nr:hypothetical protein C5S53_06440 [Methanophagales archaeon]
MCWDFDMGCMMRDSWMWKTGLTGISINDFANEIS